LTGGVLYPDSLGGRGATEDAVNNRQIQPSIPLVTGTGHATRAKERQRPLAHVDVAVKTIGPHLL